MGSTNAGAGEADGGRADRPDVRVGLRAAADGAGGEGGGGVLEEAGGGVRVERREGAGGREDVDGPGSRTDQREGLRLLAVMPWQARAHTPLTGTPGRGGVRGSRGGRGELNEHRS